MNRLRWLAILMTVTIVGITGFQGYWLYNNYQREQQNMAITLASGFHRTVLDLQSSRLSLEKLGHQLSGVSEFPGREVVVKPHRSTKPPPLPKKDQQISLLQLMEEKLKQTAVDSPGKGAIIFSSKENLVQSSRLDSIRQMVRARPGNKSTSLVINTDSVADAGPRPASEGSKSSIITLTYSHSSLPPAATTGTAPGTLVVEKSASLPTPNDFIEKELSAKTGMANTVVRFLYNIDSISINDSVRIRDVDSACAIRLKADGLSGLRYSVMRDDAADSSTGADPYKVTIGFARPLVFRIRPENAWSYLLRKITLPIIFSIFLVGITVLSFVLLYRNLVRQRRLAEQKNEFISNITHELKTPIATVGVAIEALANFNAIDDPVRTREYLAISQQELQRLSMLVDKVLKLSMFEKKEIELKKEHFDCLQLVQEIMQSMRLQFEKYGARVNLQTRGNQFWVEADKLHVTSVIYNLLDNALKYSRENPEIQVELVSGDGQLELTVIDNGIGIEPAYREKVFEKFFRVPTGNRHNAKGYGLGLSYVAEVMKRHRGRVVVLSEPGKGSRFTASFPIA